LPKPKIELKGSSAKLTAPSGVLTDELREQWRSAPAERLLGPLVRSNFVRGRTSSLHSTYCAGPKRRQWQS
jgi:hypothetical protein